MAKGKNKKNLFDIILNIFIAAELVAMLNTLYRQYKDDHLTFPYFNNEMIVEPFEDKLEESCNNKKYPYGQKIGGNFESAPIIIFGDSCAYGLSLSQEDNFSGQLSQFLKRPVYNKAFGGWSVQHTYWLLTNNDFYKEYKQEPKAAIFIYTTAMFRRMYAPELSSYLRYTVIGDNIIRNNIIYNWLNVSYLFAKIFDISAVHRSKNFDNAFSDFKLYLVKGKQNADKHWKNTSFYILKMTDVEDDDNPEKWKELEREGFNVIEIRDLMGDNFKEIPGYFFSATNDHPTKIFWSDFIPKFVSKTDL